MAISSSSIAVVNAPMVAESTWSSWSIAEITSPRGDFSFWGSVRVRDPSGGLRGIALCSASLLYPEARAVSFVPQSSASGPNS